MEKLKPQKQRSVISSLKFQRKTDYQKFLKFIKLETKRLKGIEKPKESKVKDILNVGTIGLTAFGIFSLVEKGRDAINKIKGIQDDFQTPFAIGRVRDDDIKFKKQTQIGEEGFKKRIIAKKFSPDISKKIKIPKESPIFKPFRSIKKIYSPANVEKPVRSKVEKPVKPKKPIKVTAGGGPPSDNKKRAYDYFQKTKKIQVLRKDVEFVGDDVFLNKKYTNTSKPVLKLEVETFGGEDFYSFNESDSKRLTDQRKVSKLRRESLERTFKSTSQIKEGEVEAAKKLIKSRSGISYKIKKLAERFMNFYNQGRTPAEDTMPFFGKKGLIADDFSKITRTDKAYKDGATGLKGARPFKAFTPKMLKTGPTPLTRQLIERPFKSLFRAGSGISKILFNNPLVNALLKSKVTKTGLFVIDAIFAGQEFYDLFMRPGDNYFTSLHDLYVSINNAYFHNNPEKLKYYITESKGSGKFFGVGPGLTNEQIRRKEIERNLKIKRLKEAAAVEGGGGNNVIVVPQNQQNNNMSGGNNTPITTGGTEVSFLPLEPLNIGDDILLHKLNQ